MPTRNHNRLTTTTRLTAECLEDRTTPTVTSITGNLNGTAIPAGDYVWFSSVGKVSGFGTAPAVVNVTQQTIKFTAGSTDYSLSVPDSVVTFDPSAPAASLSFGTGWQVTSPTRFSGNVFLSGLAFQFPGGLPGGIKNVTWSGDFSSDTGGLKVNWQWAAAVYKSFSADEGALGVKASDSPTPAYNNSDHAGTPEAYKSFVVGGATGGGGSNFTGSLSATKTVFPELAPTPEVQVISLSGHVTNALDGSPAVGEVIALLDVYGAPVFDSNGVAITATTDANGFYKFTNLPSGTFIVAETTTTTNITSSAGTVNNQTVPDGTNGLAEIDMVVLNPGDVGINYDFVIHPTE
jgi:hypothetical protein